MSGRFIVAVDGATLPQRDAFTGYVQTLGGVAWWHFLSDVWLLNDQQTKMGAVEWRDTVRQYMPTASVFVAEVGGAGIWALYGPEASFAWLRQYWGGM